MDLTALHIGHSSCYSWAQTESKSAHLQLSKYTPWTHLPLKYYTFIQNYHPQFLPAISNIDSYVTNLPLNFNSSLSKCSAQRFQLQHVRVKCFRPNWKASAFWLCARQWGKNKRKNRSRPSRCALICTWQRKAIMPSKWTLHNHAIIVIINIQHWI